MIKTNYHTHTHYCDGKDKPEQMVLAAIEQGFSVLGFSGHSPLNDEYWTMKPESVASYREEVLWLKGKYRDQIEILLGLEQDYFSPAPTESYDFIIGSVHGVPTPGGLLFVDATAELLKAGIAQYFDGDALALAENYYALVSNVVNKTGAQIVGHLDLLTKFQEQEQIFDTGDVRYQKAARSAVRELCKTGVLFEVNTGAMSRGYRTAPYPSESLLHCIRECGGNVVLTSDCHDRRDLDHGFAEATALIRNCGFQKLAYLSQGDVRFTDL